MTFILWSSGFALHLQHHYTDLHHLIHYEWSNTICWYVGLIFHGQVIFCHKSLSSGTQKTTGQCNMASQPCGGKDSLWCGLMKEEPNC